MILALADSAQAQALPGPSNQQLSEIQLSAGALTLQNGNNSAVITVTLIDTNNKPFGGTNVIFKTTKGNLSSCYPTPQGCTAITDANGRAQATLTLAAVESVTVTASSGDKSADITVGAQPATTSVVVQVAATAAPTLPVITPGTPTEETVTQTAVATKTVAPQNTANKATPSVTATKAANPNATRPRATPGFLVAISLLSIYGALKYIRRK